MHARSYLKLLHITVLPASEMHVQMVKGALGVYFVRFKKKIIYDKANSTLKGEGGAKRVKN